MPGEYVTSETDLPADPREEVTLQITDGETREIFTTRARVARDPGALDDPEPLTVVRGPHENIEEQWYVDVIEAGVDDEAVDEAALRAAIAESRSSSNVVNTRSEDVRALLTYLVRVDEFGSVSEAARTIIREHVADERPELVAAYVERRAEFDRDELGEALRGR